ncbi:class I SAM-dependent methyltransferase [Pseudomonas sp. UL073]|uniref:Class I SAM-dependent methyltransferase n=1 Tax=Zestomonas insulae TaxID=2809017 RepID=A0ABS2IIB0_9GAMM|nr:class I SAM-dependent methyltransferase [Pseudomonas insulae]MBM7062490.1 class I SAM-dependent methyltransferase [Pseudomonas insulae]
MKDFQDYIQQLVGAGGPAPEQYLELDGWFQRVTAQLAAEPLSGRSVQELWPMFGAAFSLNTVQGFAALKPHGYSGDFEIMERLYSRWLSPLPELQNWDLFTHWHPATQAVRNRKDYFKQVMTALAADGQPRTVLNVGSGPCRDIHEYLQEHPDTPLRFECVDLDGQAIAYAQQLLNGAAVLFHQANAFTFSTTQRYDLVWSAGLFDYLNDREFVFLLKALAKLLQPGGELVVGNFSEANPSRAYMEFGDWVLHHRTDAQLQALAAQAGLPEAGVRIEREPLGVNLFLRARLA